MAKVRFLHVGTDAPAVDLAVAGEAVPWFSNYEFEDFSAEYEEVEAGTYDLEVRESVSAEALFTWGKSLLNTFG